MAEPSIDMEKVVRQVLAELGLTPPQASADAPQRRQPSGSAPGEPNGELSVASQVVTMAELQGRLEGIRRLVVPPRAVVTPSVRDELHRRKITLVYERRGPAASAGSVRLVAMVLGSRFDPAPLVRALENEGIEVDMRRTDCLVDATDQLADVVAKPNVLGLLVSTCPGIGLCLANRHRGVRAVLGIDAATASADAASVGANLLVVNPLAAGFLQLKQMVARFCREGPRECPELLRERLG